MEDVITKNVFQIVGNGTCVEAADGDKVYDVIYQFIEEKHKVVLSFLNVTMLTSAFLNNAIGKLYKDFSEDEVRTYLSVSDLDVADTALLKKVVKFAKSYYKNPERLEASIKEVLGDE